MADRGGASGGGAKSPQAGSKSPRATGQQSSGATGQTPAGSGKKRHRKKHHTPKQSSEDSGKQSQSSAAPAAMSAHGETKLPEVKCEQKSKNSPKSSNREGSGIELKSTQMETTQKDSAAPCSSVQKEVHSKDNTGKPCGDRAQKGQEGHVGPGQSSGKGEEKGASQTKGQGQVATAGEVVQKSKAELKAERRAKQEAQRATKFKKADGTQSAPPAGKKEAPRVPDNMMADVEGARKKIVKKLEKQQVPVRTVVQRKVRLFSHLHQYEREVSLTQSLPFSNGVIHSAIVKLGLQYAEGIINGSNARCIGLLAAFKKVIADYVTPPHKELSRDLEAKIKPYISFLTQCRPLSVSMGNAIKHVKWHIRNVPGDMSDAEAKQILLECIENYWREKIMLAGEAISKDALLKIADGDVIMVYACSSLIIKVLCDAHKAEKKFRVIVVDGRPRLEGKEMLRRLVQSGIQCSYVLITAVSYVMKEVTKVFLGAHGLLANGFVMSRVGSSLIALVAKSCNVPVLVCCETYKFCERAQTDSFVCNELGDPDDLVEIGNKQPYLWDWRDYQSLSLLNLVYDVTPPEFISMVITELGMIPCTSVPVVLRVKHVETDM